jgi:hypothetical protein
MLLVNVKLKGAAEQILKELELVMEGLGLTVIETVCVEPEQPFAVGITE